MIFYIINKDTNHHVRIVGCDDFELDLERNVAVFNTGNEVMKWSLSFDEARIPDVDYEKPYTELYITE